MSYNSEDFQITDYQRKAAPGELVNYRSSLIRKKENDTPHQTVWFEDFADLVDCVDFNKQNDFWDDGGVPIAEEKMQTWTFGSHLPNKETTGLSLRSGQSPQVFVDKFETKRDELFKTYPELNELELLALSMKRRRVFSEDGGDLNIDRYMSGEVEMWERTTKVAQKKTIKICFNGWVNAGMSASEITTKMIAAIAVLDIIQSAGIAVELWLGYVGESVTNSTNISTVFAKIKSGDEPMDVSRILSISAPGCFRYYIFTIASNIFRGKPKQSLGRATFYVPSFIKDIYEFDVCMSLSDTESNIITVLSNSLKDINT